MAIISAGLHAGATQGDLLNRKKTPSPKPGRSGSRSTPPENEKDTFTPMNAWKQQLEEALKMSHTIEKRWQTLALDKKDTGIQICHLLRQSVENYDTLTKLTQQGRERGILKFEYTLDGQPRTYVLPESNAASNAHVSYNLSNYFREELEKIEQHSVGSDRYKKAVSDFILNFWD